MHLLWFILIGLAAGWIASHMTTGSGLGILGDIVVGLLGAVIGGYLFRALGVHRGFGIFGSLLVATIGAIVLIFLLHLFKRV